MAIRVYNLMGQALLSPTEYERFVTDELDFAEEPFRRQMRVLNLMGQILVQPGGHPDASNTIFWDDEVIFINFIGDREVPENTLELEQDVHVFGYETVVDELGLVDTVDTTFDYAAIVSPLGLQQDAQSVFGVSWLPYEFEDELNLFDPANVAYNVSASNTLALVQTMYRSFTFEHTISFVETVQKQVGDTDVSQPIALIQTLSTFGSIFRQVVTHGNILRQSFTYYVDGPCARKAYQQFDGEGDGGGVSDKRLAFRSDFVLETVGMPKTILRLRNPETDNRDRLGFSRVNRETRGGELNVFADPIWSKVNTLLFTIVALKPEKIYALESFLYDTLGREIKITDWTGTVWLGVVTTPGEASTEDGRNAWTISFEFEGTAYPGQAPDDHLSFTEIVSTAGSLWTRQKTETNVVSQTVYGGHPIPSSNPGSLALAQVASAVLIPA